MPSNQLTAIFQHLLTSLLFIIPIVIVTVAIIFLLNRFLTDKNGRTNDRACAIIGLVIFLPLYLVVFINKWGMGWQPILAAIVLGGLIGGLSFTLDEIMIDFWKNRRVTLPAVLGLLLGGWLWVTMFSQVWLEGTMYITHKACTSRVVIERNTRHTDDDGDNYYTYDYYTHHDKTALGEIPPKIVEGVDYKLGYGAEGKQDRVGKWETYQWIGGHLFSEKRNRWQNFRWLLLATHHNSFSIDEVQIVQSNFYGQPIKNGGRVEPPLPVPHKIKRVPLPSDLPPPTTASKVIGYAYNFFVILFQEEEYRFLLYLFLGTVGLLVVLATFFPPLREPITIFLVCASIVILIILMIVAARTGTIGAFGEGGSGRRTGGGGGFGGRGLSR